MKINIMLQNFSCISYLFKPPCYDVLELSFLYGKNINILYNFDANFYLVINLVIKLGT